MPAVFAMDFLTPLPQRFNAWFASRGWAPRAHQLAMVDKARAGRHALLIAPTGGGKTLAGFLPSLIELSERPPANTPRGIHTLYISPLKALAVDVERNLLAPILQMGLPIVAESRTGDTGVARKARQRLKPPDILLTTPEQLALFLAWEGARLYFADLRCVILDEVHAIWPSKRGDLLNLHLARLQVFAPEMRRVGLSATVDDPGLILKWMSPGTASSLPPVGGWPDAVRTGGKPSALLEERVPHPVAGATTLPQAGGKHGSDDLGVDLVLGPKGPAPLVEVLDPEGTTPWTGHTAQHAMPEVYDIIRRHKMTLVFVNTRFQAEFAFQELWAINDDNLPIGLHHGSLGPEQRRKVEAAMARGALKAVVCTSTLDLGIDWGDVDLVIQLAAPKGSSRMVQRIGRANHRLDEPSEAILVPANRFEVLECRAAANAMVANDLDGDPPRTGALDVLAQHVMGCACSEPFDLLALYDEVCTAGAYRELPYEDFEQVVDFVSTGGYALKTYDHYRRIVKTQDGLWTVRNEETRRRHRMNSGAIVSAAVLSVRLTGRGKRPGRKIGEVEEGYLEQLESGDTFVFAGAVWRLESITAMDVLVTPAPKSDPKMPSWGGSKFPLSTFLAKRVREMMWNTELWAALPDDVREWLEIQKDRSGLPEPDQLLVETFPQGNRHYLVCYSFEGRHAHNTLAMLLTRRLDRLGVGPLGFNANDYAVAIWSLKPMHGLDLDALFDQDMLGDDLESWLAESYMMKATFKKAAIISGLIERRFPGQEKSGRQITFSADLIYDVLRKHDPDHLLLRCARTDAASDLLDVRRLGTLLERIRGRIRHIPLEHVSPFAVPILVEIGRQRSPGDAGEMILADMTDALIAEAME
jgi:ATP-dependent Lhr-like helicase